MCDLFLKSQGLGELELFFIIFLLKSEKSGSETDLELSKKANQEETVPEKSVEKRHELTDATFLKPSVLTSTPHDEHFGAPSSSPTLGFWTKPFANCSH